MSLLREIQTAAIDASVPLPTLLRKCAVLGARLGNAEFKRWVNHELNGYPGSEELPAYRRLGVHSKGNFSGAFGSFLKAADIPLSCIPSEKLREALGVVLMSQPAAGLEVLVQHPEEGYVSEQWNPEIVARYGRQIYQDMNCLQAWKVIPIPSIVSMVDAIRNRVLAFAIEIEAQDPEAGERAQGGASLTTDRVQQIYNTLIVGPVSNLAMGSSNVNQSATIGQQHATVFSGLIEAISRAGGDQQVRAALLGLVEEMRDSETSDRFRSKYKDFMSLLADHLQVFGPLIAQCLPSLTALL